jgi:hypothetical protein
MNENHTYLPVLESRGPFQGSLLSAFDEIAQTFRDISWNGAREGPSSLQKYLDGGVAILAVFISPAGRSFSLSTI